MKVLIIILGLLMSTYTYGDVTLIPNGKKHDINGSIVSCSPRPIDKNINSIDDVTLISIAETIGLGICKATGDSENGERIWTVWVNRVIVTNAFKVDLGIAAKRLRKLVNAGACN